MKQQIILRKFFLLFVIFMSTLMITCKKEEIQGPKGEPGTPGGGGNASINNSSIFTIATTQWKAKSDSSGWVVSINSELITQAVAEKGAVKVYELLNDSWWELPFTQGDLFTQFGFVAGKVDLEFVDIHGGLPARPATTSYRLVVFSESARIMPYSNLSETKSTNASFN
jgi:hypothetical protein